MNKKTTIQGLKIHYIKKGKKDPLVILHGWGGSSNSWSKIIDSLSEKYTVICPDLPGFGKSDDPKRAWNINEYSDFILNFLDKLKINDFYLLGHSFGGGIAIKITAKKPQLIKKLILCDAAIVRAKERLTPRQKIVKLGAKIVKPLKNNKIIESIKPLAYRLAGTKDYFSANNLMKETFKKVRREDLRAFASYIKKPTLIIWGENDKITPLEDAYIIKDMIDEAELKIIEDTDHSPHLRKPDELSKTIEDFIKKQV